MSAIINMSEPDLWSEQYFIDQIERKIKNEISMKYFVQHERRPTVDEYKNIWSQWTQSLKLNITDFDLGIYDEKDSR